MSSLKSTESNMLLLIELCDEAVGCLMLWVTTCSFCGGAGGWSTCGMGALSPSGPKGPRESSRASRRTGCVPGLRGVRGLRPAGDLRSCDEEASRDCFDFEVDSGVDVRCAES
jgi:hypothetical protein